jgi:hypothetical protein
MQPLGHHEQHLRDLVIGVLFVVTTSYFQLVHQYSSMPVCQYINQRMKNIAKKTKPRRLLYIVSWDNG